MIFPSLFYNLSKPLLKLKDTVHFSDHDSLAAIYIEYDCSNVVVSLRLFKKIIIVPFQVDHSNLNYIRKKTV